MDVSSMVLNGDPWLIRASAGRWQAFGDAADEAADDLAGLKTGEFIGDEADLYRGRMNKDLTPHLRTAGTAWHQVQRALNSYADALQDLQAKMSRLQSQAAAQQQTVNAAAQAVSRARSADFTHTMARQQEIAGLQPGQTAPTDTYTEALPGAQSHLSSANTALQGLFDQASTLCGQNRAAAQACAKQINDAAKLRFAKPPGFWGRVGNFIKDHADALQSISAVLKTISAIAGVLSLIPCLAPIMGPIALISGGLALGIDLTLKLVAGKGSWADIGLDAVGLVPGLGQMAKGAAFAKVAQIGAEGSRLRSFGEVAYRIGSNETAWKIANHYAGEAGFVLTAYQVGQGKASWADLVAAGVGIKLPAGGKFEMVQGLVSGGTNFAASGYDIADKYLGFDEFGRKNPPTWQDWVGLGTSAATFAASGGDVKVYGSEPGDHAMPNFDGTRRTAWSKPTYSAQQSMQIISNSVAGLGHHGRHVG